MKTTASRAVGQMRASCQQASMNAANTLILLVCLTLRLAMRRTETHNLRSQDTESADGIGGFPQADGRLRPDHCQHPISTPRSSLAAAGLCVAGLRCVSPLSGAAAIS